MEWRLILGGPAGLAARTAGPSSVRGAGSGGPSGGPDGPFACAGAVNMAVDRALLDGVRAGDPPALRLYRWSTPCLSLGRNQPASGRLDPAATRRRGIEVVRRPTGGGAVLHDRELTYAVALPVDALDGPRGTYRALNRALVAGLRRLGVAAEVAGDRSVPVRPSGPCFAAAASGEVVVGGRKLVGSAQRRERRALLQHGSILLGGDQRIVAELLDGEASPVTATLEAVLGRVPGDAELVDALRSGFEDVLGVRPRDAAGDLDRAAVERLVRRFESDEWTWRR